MCWIDADGTILRQTDPWTKHAKACRDFNATRFELRYGEKVVFTAPYGDVICYSSRD